MKTFIVQTEARTTRQYIVEAESSQEAVSFIEGNEEDADFFDQRTSKFYAVSSNSIANPECIQTLKKIIGVTEEDDCWDDDMVESFVNIVEPKCDEER